MARRRPVVGGGLGEPVDSDVRDQERRDLDAAESRPLSPELVRRARLRTVVWCELRPHPLQPKERHDAANVRSLRESIRNKELLQPPLIRRLPDGTYQVLVGHRRTAAVQQLVLEGAFDRKGKVFVIDGLSDAEALEIIVAEYFQQAKVESDVAMAEWVGGVADHYAGIRGRPVALRDLGHLIPAKKMSKSTLAEWLRIYAALQNPDLEPLVRASDKAGKMLLYKALGLPETRAQEALRAFVSGGSSAMRQVIAAAPGAPKGPEASPVKRRTRRNGAYEVTFLVRADISPGDAARVLSELEAVREDVAKRTGAEAPARVRRTS